MSRQTQRLTPIKDKLSFSVSNTMNECVFKLSPDKGLLIISKTCLESRQTDNLYFEYNSI